MAHSRHKMVILCEGRDAAGKGGVIIRAEEALLARTHTAEAPWWVVQAADKKRARLHCIAHLLAQMPEAEVACEAIALPARVRNPDATRQPAEPALFVPECDRPQGLRARPRA